MQSIVSGRVVEIKANVDCFMVNVFRWVGLCLFFLNISYFVWVVAIKEGDSDQVNDVELDVGGAGTLMLLSERPVQEEVKEALDSELLAQDPNAGEIPSEQLELGKNSLASLEAAAGPKVALESMFSEVSCPSLGPFSNEKEMGEFNKKLTQSGLHAVARVASTPDSRKYRVYLSPYSDKLAAIGALKKLRAKKIDSYIMTGDELENAISLGIFSQPDSAENLVARMNSFGYPAKMKAEVYTKEVYWLDLTTVGNAEKVDLILIDLLSEIKGLTRIDSPCKTIALNQ